MSERSTQAVFWSMGQSHSVQLPQSHASQQPSFFCPVVQRWEVQVQRNVSTSSFLSVLLLFPRLLIYAERRSVARRRSFQVISTFLRGYRGIHRAQSGEPMKVSASPL